MHFRTAFHLPYSRIYLRKEGIRLGNDGVDMSHYQTVDTFKCLCIDLTAAYDKKTVSLGNSISILK